MNRKVLNFKDFLKESYGMSSQSYGMNLSSSFGTSDLSSIGSGGIAPRDKDLGFDEVQRHANDVKDKINRFVQIEKSIFAGGMYNTGYDFIAEIEDLYIAKIFTNNNGLLDIYIRFILQEQTFYGKFENWGGINAPVFTSKVLHLPIISAFSDNKLRLIGLLTETLKKWFSPKEDMFYRTLKDVTVYSNLGKIIIIPEGGRVEIVDVILQEYKSIIYIKYGEDVYTFSGIDYYFFRWWFKQEEEKEYYL